MCSVIYWIPFLVVSYAARRFQLQKDGRVSYDGAQVWQTPLRSASDILLIKQLIDNEDISIWNLAPHVADFLVHPEDKLKVHRQLRSRQMNHSVIIMNVQPRIDGMQTEPEVWSDNTLRIGHRMSWKKFPTLKIIHEYLNYLKRNYRSICKISHIGHTAENRTLQMITISNGNPANKAILLTAGAHAREWISITSVLYILDNIVSKFDSQPEEMKNKDWLIVPVLNPDGFEYTHTKDRLWRKNRRKISSTCEGVDINRNFGAYWNVSGISDFRCKETYSGPSEFSEQESKAIRDVIQSSKKKPHAYIDFHAYGQLILYSWCARPHMSKDAYIHKSTAEGMSKAIYDTTKQHYTFGTAYHKVYPATGSAIDWAYSFGVSHSYAIEASDTGDYGFLVPPHYIESTGKELLSAVKYLAKALEPQHVNRGGKYISWF